MVALCPKCQNELTIEMKHLDDDTALVCKGCRSILKIVLTLDVLAESTKPPVPASSAPSGPRGGSASGKKALIAIDGEGTRDLIKEILTDAGFSVVDAPSGKDVIPLAQQHRPAVVLVDVGLSDVLGTELCASIKKNPEFKETVVILVASIYDKNTKYRRQPDSLFGAEDYIERHNIQKELLVKIKKHLDGKQKPLEVKQRPASGVKAAPIQEESFEMPEERGPAPSRPASGPERKPAQPAFGAEAAVKTMAAPEAGSEAVENPKDHENAKRLARIIVSDIVLYNKKKVDDGIRNNTFYDVLKEEIEEGRKHYLSRVSPDLHKSKDYYKEAFEEFIKKRKAII